MRSNVPVATRHVLRYYSIKIPDNAPSATDNQEWLQQLANMKQNSHKRLGVNKKTSVQDYNKFNIEILDNEDTAKASPYLTVKAPLAAFTSLNYVKSYKNKRQLQEGLVDVRIVKCRSGKGGNGAISFFRDAGRAIGPPDGGDGGDGGSVYVRAVEGMNSLAKLRTSYIAKDGANGGGRQLDGARGKDILIEVPVGTVIRWSMDPKVLREYIQTKVNPQVHTSLQSTLDEAKLTLQCSKESRKDRNPSHIQLFRDNYAPGGGWIFKDKSAEYHQNKDWFQDLNKKISNYDLKLTEEELEDDRFPLYGIDLNKPSKRPICLLRGGKGGLGNMHFLTNLIRNPRFAKVGRNGLEQFIMFELKSIADLGLVGLPNAGKSTILDRISHAKPRIGHWEFTTLSPTIGTVSLGIDKPTFTVADIPGIIEDASLNKGMGLEFIRHIERSKGWVFVISLEDKNPLGTLHTLINELGGIERIKNKNVLVACNKADLTLDNPEAERQYLAVEAFCSEQGWDAIPLSALKMENIEALVEKMAKCARNLS